jgi:hypothetical protein
MKVWIGHGSEHSANLVMLGRFADAEHARAAEEAFRRITEQASSDSEEEFANSRDPDSRFSDEMLNLLRELNSHSLGPVDVEQFRYEYALERTGAEISIHTDELDVQGFLKVMIDKGARVEIFSTDDHQPAGGDAAA